jgi:predicted ferric reductase
LILTTIKATIAFVVIFLQSLSPFRHSFYEFFLHFHIVLVTASFVALWYHLHKFVQKWIVLAAIIAWAADVSSSFIAKLLQVRSLVLQRLLRLAIVAWRNCGKSLTSATIQLLPGDVARVDVTVTRPWKFKAGQYMYLYIPALGLWTSHPFSAAWESFDQSHGSIQSERSSNNSVRSILSGTGRDTQRTVSFLIRKRDGFTRKMMKSIGIEFGLQRRVLALAEGPFGTSYET